MANMRDYDQSREEQAEKNSRVETCSFPGAGAKASLSAIPQAAAQLTLTLTLTLAPHRHRHRRCCCCCCCAVRTVQCNARKSATVVSCPETRNELREQAAARPKAPSTLAPLALWTCFQAKWCEWPRMIDSGLEWNRGWHSAASCAKKADAALGRPQSMNDSAFSRGGQDRAGQAGQGGSILRCISPSLLHNLALTTLPSADTTISGSARVSINILTSTSSPCCRRTSFSSTPRTGVAALISCQICPYSGVRM